MDHTRCRLQVDVIAGTETGTDWTWANMVGRDAYYDILGVRKDKNDMYAHNETKQATKSQYEGTYMMAFGVFSSHIKNVSLNPDKCKDRRGLGSYCSLVTTGNSAKPVRIVTYYRPNDKSRHKTSNKGRQPV